MQCDEEREPDAEHDQRNKEVGVSEYGSGVMKKCHLSPVSVWMIDSPRYRRRIRAVKAADGGAESGARSRTRGKPATTRQAMKRASAAANSEAHAGTISFQERNRIHILITDAEE
jgi:hypothetical protein